MVRCLPYLWILWKDRWSRRQHPTLCSFPTVRVEPTLKSRRCVHVRFVEQRSMTGSVSFTAQTRVVVSFCPARTFIRPSRLTSTLQSGRAPASRFTRSALYSQNPTVASCPAGPRGPIRRRSAAIRHGRVRHVRFSRPVPALRWPS